MRLKLMEAGGELSEGMKERLVVKNRRMSGGGSESLHPSGATADL